MQTSVFLGSPGQEFSPNLLGAVMACPPAVVSASCLWAGCPCCPGPPGLLVPFSVTGASRLGCRRREGPSCFIPGLLPLDRGLLVPASGCPAATRVSERPCTPPLGAMFVCFPDPLGLWKGTSAWASHLSAEDTHRDTRAHTNCREEVLLRAHRHTRAHTHTLGKGILLRVHTNAQMHTHTHTHEQGFW